MASHELFPNPLVKTVIFQIRFPNLFYLADRIGDFQVKVMKEFPKSELVIRRQFLITDEEDEQKREEMAGNVQQEAATRTWRFESEHGVRLEISSASLTLVSQRHKSYKLGTGERFRDVIGSTCQHFFSSTNVPLIKRIGLRYIDECPVFEGDSQSFRQQYNTVFPLDRFPIEDAAEMNYKVVVDRGQHKLRYMESLRREGQDWKFNLDFDGWAIDVEPQDTLEVTDALHEIIWNEFIRTINEPILEYMRRPVEVANASE